jgi:uncharacterized phosphatase
LTKSRISSTIKTKDDKMKICLLRHGETEWNNLGKLQGREDVPLNVMGIEQIRGTVKYFKKTDWKIIITSPLVRAKASAEIISKEIGGIKIHEEIDFIERDYGKASGMTVKERQTVFPDGEYIGIEPFEALQNRTVNALKKYMEKYKGNNIIIVSHGAAINSIVAYLSKNELGAERAALKNACITLLEEVDKEIRIKYYNKIVDEITLSTS